MAPKSYLIKLGSAHQLFHLVWLWNIIKLTIKLSELNTIYIWSLIPNSQTQYYSCTFDHQTKSNAMPGLDLVQLLVCNWRPGSHGGDRNKVFSSARNSFIMKILWNVFKNNNNWVSWTQQIIYCYCWYFFLLLCPPTWLPCHVVAN